MVLEAQFTNIDGAVLTRVLKELESRALRSGMGFSGFVEPCGRARLLLLKRLWKSE